VLWSVWITAGHVEGNFLLVGAVYIVVILVNRR